MSQISRRRGRLNLSTPPKTNTTDTIWDVLCSRLKEGSVIPILSNNLHGDRIFAPLFAQLSTVVDGHLNDVMAKPSAVSPKLIVDEMLAEFWAEAIGYPLYDPHSLARVAQFNRVKSIDDMQAKRRYLTFLKETLLHIVDHVDANSAMLTEELRTQLNERTFSAMVSDLDFIYITTSYYDFMERAIVAEGRAPRTQICGDIANLSPEHRIERDYIPSAEQPVVYHLHGLKNYPRSLVLSEDDYLKFLVRVTQPTDPEKPAIPLYLNPKLANSTFLLLGYRLQDWDFRATFRGLLTHKEVPRDSISVAIQLAPDIQGDAHDIETAQSYLNDYFKAAQFRVEWSDSDSFVRALWREWNRWRKGEI